MSNPRGTLLAFLPLGPVTSNSYPKAPEARPAVAAPAAASERRPSTSSVSSASSAGNVAASGFRILKVAPVHFGEHGGDHQSDWHEVSATSPETVFNFLPLGPVTSNSYPKVQQPRAPVAPGAAAAAAAAAHKRRTSSLSSDGRSGFRVLKVAPVHYGEHGGEHQQDWHDVPEAAVEE